MPSIRYSGVPIVALLPITVGTAVLSLSGAIADTPFNTALVCVAILVFGLPHGSFDLALLRRSAGGDSQSSRSTIGLVLLYLGCAGAMYAAWRYDPTLALGAFLLMATAHFAEDWEDCGSRFIATGIAAGILAAPAFLHSEQLGMHFVTLTGTGQAAVLADLMLLVAPTALAISVVGLALLWQSGRRSSAIAAGCALTAMLLLPPVLGFGLFFCLVHSPIQFRKNTDALHLVGIRQWGAVVIPLSLGALGIATVILVLHDAPTFSEGAFASSFMTLSVLTLPHMLVPLIANRLRRRPTLARA